jgi:O-succinylhomoserine sulfhydrylase
LTPQERERAGIGEGLVRVSVGLEDPADVQRDLERGLRELAG